MPEHWQTLLEQKLAERDVGAADGARQAVLRRVGRRARPNRWRAIEGPVILVAHSAGVMIVVHWAQRHRPPDQGARCSRRRPDFESPLPDGYPTQDVAAAERLAADAARAAAVSEHRRRRAPTIRWAAYERVAELAAAWGSRLVDIGAVGHLNPAAGYGEWPQAEELIRELC